MKKRKKYLYLMVGLNSQHPYIINISASEFRYTVRSMLDCFDGTILHLPGDCHSGYYFVSDMVNALVLRVPLK